MRVSTLVSAVTVLLFGISSNNAFALSYPQGVIGSIYFSGATNYAVRVFLGNVTDPCGTNGSSFVYINAADSNYAVYVAGLLMAKAQGSRVYFIAAPDTNNICHIVEFSVGD